MGSPERDLPEDEPSLRAAAPENGYTFTVPLPVFTNIAALPLGRQLPHQPVHFPQDLSHQPEQQFTALLHSSPAPASLSLPSLPDGSTSSHPHPVTPLVNTSQADQHLPVSALHSAAAAAAATATGPEQPQLSAAAGGTGFSALSLDELRRRQHAFAAERDWDKFHTPRNLMLALVGEVGELAAVFQWKGDVGASRGLPGFSAAERLAVQHEVSDVLLYLVRLAEMCGIDLAAAVLAKLELNAKKYPADRVRGSSAKYNTYPQHQDSSPLHATDLASHPPASAPGTLPSAVHHQQQLAAAQELQMSSAAKQQPAAQSLGQALSASASGTSGDRTSDSKRKRFSEDQVKALEYMAEQASWRLQNVPKAQREQLQADWDISQERLHNFINNRKPKEMKKARTVKPSSDGLTRFPPAAQGSESQPDSEQQAESVE